MARIFLNGETLFAAFKLPDVFAKFCVVLARCVVERHLMVSEPSFKFRGYKTYIGFGFSGRRHLGLVNDSFRDAISLQGALSLAWCPFGDLNSSLYLYPLLHNPS